MPAMLLLFPSVLWQSCLEGLWHGHRSPAYCPCNSKRSEWNLYVSGLAWISSFSHNMFYNKYRLGQVYKLLLKPKSGDFSRGRGVWGGFGIGIYVYFTIEYSKYEVWPWHPSNYHFYLLNWYYMEKRISKEDWKLATPAPPGQSGQLARPILDVNPFCSNPRVTISKSFTNRIHSNDYIKERYWFCLVRMDHETSQELRMPYSFALNCQVCVL